MNILSCNCAGKWGAYAPLILRVVTGAIFLLHGWQKLEMGVPGVTGFLGSLGFPIPGFFAIVLIAAEILGGLFLILGLFTHWAAKITAFVALVALLTVHIGNGFYASEGGYEFILLILAAAVSVMITGPGKWALDSKFRKGGA
jgi:putative oxidoreductase